MLLKYLDITKDYLGDDKLLLLLVAAPAVSHGHHHRVSILLVRPPLVRGESGDIRLGLGVEILLEQLGLPGDFERDHLAETVVVQSVGREKVSFYISIFEE